MKLAGVCLVTHNMSKMKSFYEKVFDVAGVGDEIHLSFSFESGHLSICHTSLVEEMSGQEFEGNSNQIIEFAVSNIDEKYNKIMEIATIVKPIKTEPWGIR